MRIPARVRRSARVSKIKQALALALMMACVALLLYPSLLKTSPRDVYKASGRALAFPDVEMPGGTVSVNQADLYELIELPGVGEVIGQAIIDEREERGFFYYPEDLLAVRGIGEKTLEKIRDMLDMTMPAADE